MEPLLQQELEQLEPFIEKDTELSKPDLIHRCEGRVSHYLEVFLNMVQFYRIGKDHDGKVYLV